MFVLVELEAGSLETQGQPLRSHCLQEVVIILSATVCSTYPEFYFVFAPGPAHKDNLTCYKSGSSSLSCRILEWRHKRKEEARPQEPNAVAFKYKPLASQIGSHGLWLREFGGMKHPGFSE